MTETIRKVTVLGAGTMGHGIAQVAAQASFDVALYDVSDDAARAGVDRVGKNLEKGVSLGKVDAEEKEQVLRRIRPSSSLETAVSDADLIVEAVPESAELKTRLFTEVEASVREDAILATNTSSLSVGDMASGLSHPERFLGLHFFNPVFIMKLVEVVWWEGTDRDVLDRTIEFVRALDKEPVIVKDSPGFASSRLGVILGLEAMRMVEEGVASAKDIDKAMELGYRHPMGPLKLTDLVGLDIRLGIAEYLHEKLGSESFAPPEILRQMVRDGKLGKKSGQGFYDWEGGA